MGMRPTHDPYGGQNPLVDKLIGVPAYEVVRRVACNLDYIRAVGCNIERVFQVSENLDDIKRLVAISEDITQLALHADEIALIAEHYPEIQEVYEKIPELLEVNIEIEKAYQASNRAIDAADLAEGDADRASDAADRAEAADLAAGGKVQALRDDLADVEDLELGAALVGRNVIAVDSIAGLLALPDSVRRGDLRYLVKGYYAATDVGGGEFYWDATSTAADNGGTVFAVAGVATGRFVRRFDGAVDVTWFGARPLVPSASEIQACLDFIAAEGKGDIIIDRQYPIESPITISRTGVHRQGFINIHGAGGRLYKHSTFSGDRLVNIRFSSSDEDYLNVYDLFVDGVDKDVNGIDWFNDDIAYNALRSEHFIADASYDKGVSFFGVSVEGCYRGIRHSGNGTRFFGCIFRNNRCGEFRVAASNDVSFFGCSFRRNQIGSHVATNETGYTTLGATYSGCVWESNSVVGFLNHGAGMQTITGPYFEANGTNTALNDYLDKPSVLDSLSVNYYQNAVGGFVNHNVIIGGGQAGGAAGAVDASIYAAYARGLVVKMPRDKVMLGATASSAEITAGEIAYISDLVEGEEYSINGVRHTWLNGVARPVTNPINLVDRVISGYRVSSAGLQTILEFEVPVEGVGVFIEVEAVSSKSPWGSRVPKYEKVLFGVARHSTTNVMVNEDSTNKIIFDGPNTTVGDSENAIGVALSRSGTEAIDQPQKIKLDANIGASGATSRASFRITIKQNGLAYGQLSVVTNNLTASTTMP